MTQTSWGANIPVQETLGGTNQSSYNTGDIIYASSSNTLSKLSAATDGQILTLASGVPSWATFDPGTFTKIAEANISNDATVDFTSVLGSANAYFFLLTDILPATNSTSLYMRTSTDNGSTWDSTSGDYAYAFFGQGTSSGSGGSTSATFMNIGDSHSSTYAKNYMLFLYNPSGTNYTYMDYIGVGLSANGNYDMHFGNGLRKSSADVDAVRFLMSSGNISAGNIDIYEIKTS